MSDDQINVTEDDTQGHRVRMVEDAGDERTVALEDDDDVEGHRIRTVQDGGIEDRNVM